LLSCEERGELILSGVIVVVVVAVVVVDVIDNGLIGAPLGVVLVFVIIVLACAALSGAGGERVVAVDVVVFGASFGPVLRMMLVMEFSSDAASGVMILLLFAPDCWWPVII